MRRSLIAAGLASLVVLVGALPAVATYPGSGNKTLYAERTSGTSFDLRSIKSKTGGTSLVYGSGAASSFPGDYSPNGNKVTFFRNGGGDFEIWVADASGLNAAPITTNTNDDRDPSFSPDGKQIVFVRDGDIWIMDSDGNNAAMIYPGNQATRPVWKPTDGRIAFSDRDLSFNMDIFSMKPNGSDVQPLAHSGSVNELMGDYSPDGKHIVYQRSYGSGADAIYRMNSDGTKRKVFISNSGNDLIFPRYSANAKYLLYNKEVNPVEIWRARASDGKQKKALLQTAVDNFLFIQA